MSHDLKVVRIQDDRLALDTPKVVVAEEGPASSTYQQVQASNPSSLNPVFSIQTPSYATGINRKMYWRMSGSLVIAGTNLEELTLQNRICFRQFPLQNACQSMQVQVNDSTLSVGNMNQIIAALLRKGLTSKSLGGELSDVNCAPDTVSDYTNAMQATGIFDPPSYSPYSNYTSQSRCLGIKSFSLNVEPAATALTIEFEIVEPLLCPPFSYGDDSATKSIFGVNTLQVTANMGNFHRMLSLALSDTTATVTSVALVPTAQQLLVNFVTAKDRSITIDPERDYIYGYTQTNTYINTLTSGTVGAGALVAGSSNVIDLPTVPKGILIAVTYSEVDRADPTKSLPDVFLPIQSIQCSFMTRSGLLSGATPQQLYHINTKNGVAYPAWAAAGQPLVSSAASSPFALGAGNVLYLDCAQDLSLPDGIAPGMTLRSQFSVDSIACFNNTNSDLLAPRLIVIALTDSMLINTGGASKTTASLVPTLDDETLKAGTVMMRSELQRMAANGGYGGGFFDFLKNVGQKALDIGKSTLLPLANAVVPKFAPELAPALGVANTLLGGARQKAGAVLGGARHAGAVLGGARRNAQASRHRLENLLSQ